MPGRRFSGDQRWAAAFEAAGDSAQELTIKLGLLRRAREAFRLYGQEEEADRLRDKIDEIETAAERASRPPKPPPVEEPKEDEEPEATPAEVVGELEALTREGKFGKCQSLLYDRHFKLRPKLAYYFEARADQCVKEGRFDLALEAFFIAIHSSDSPDSYRLRGAAREARRADWEHKRLTPVPTEPLPEPLNWSDGIGRAEWLALRGQTEDADELIEHLRNELGEPELVLVKTATAGNQQVERYFEEVSRELSDDSPNLAEWFEDRAHFGIFPEARRRPSEPRHKFQALLKKLVAGLKESQPEQVAALQPGVTVQQLDEFEAEFRVKLTDDFRELYQWRNGQREGLEYDRILLPIDEIAEIKRGMDAKLGVEICDPTQWRRGWAPFHKIKEGDDYHCLDLCRYDKGELGQIVTYYHDESIRPVDFDSLRDWLEQYTDG